MARRRNTPEEIASGLGNPTVAELVALVHRVNPTDRGLRPAEQAERYALKSRLQSRLVRDWADHLTFRLDDADHDIVSIEHRGHARDAAHARLSSLDPDARSLICRDLDLPLEPEVLRSLDGSLQLPTDPLSVGRRALAAWDYELARERFEEAFAGSGSEAAAHALVDLFVEHLALDGEALRLDLPERVLSGRVARLVALAAARSCETRRASALLKRLDPLAEAEVRLVLADIALAERAAGEVRGHLDALRSLDPANGALTRLEDGLRALDAVDRAPFEALLAKATQPDAIRAAALALLAVAPSHGGAKGALARLDDRDRQAEILKVLESADQNAAAAQWDLAVADLQRAAERGADVRDRLEAARAVLAQARGDEATAAAAAALETGEVGPYLDLPSERRAGLRQRRPDPRLDQLELLVGDKVRDPAAALRAIEEAERDLARGRPEQALSALQRAGGDQWVAARAVVHAVREAIGALQRERAEALVQRILVLVDAGDDRAAEALADTLRIEHLPEERREAVTQVVRDLVSRVSSWRFLAAFDQEVVMGRAFDARVMAKRVLVDRPTDATWLHRLAALETRISRTLPSKVVPPWAEHLYDAHPPQIQLSADACLELDGRHAWLTESRAHFNFLRRIEVATSKVVSCTVLRTLHPFTRPRTAVFGEVICIAAVGGFLAFVRMGEGGACTEVIGYAGLQGSFVPKPECVDPGRDAALRPLIRDFGSGRQDEPAYFLLDVADGNQLHRFDRLFSCHPVRLADGIHRLLQHHKNSELRLYDPASRTNERAGRALRVDAATVSPGGDGVVCVGTFPPADGEDHAIALLIPDGVPTVRTGLPSLRRGIHPLATSRKLQLTFLLGETRAGGLELMAFDGRLRRLWSLADPSLAHLITDAEDNHAVVIFNTDRGPVLRTLGAEPPEIPSGGLSAARTFPSMVPNANATSGTMSRLGGLPAESGAEPDATTPLRDAITRCDKARSPEARFRAVDEVEVWRTAELQALARLADAAMDWAEGPWAQRLHAVAGYVDAFLRREQNQDAFELDGLPTPWSAARLQAVKDRAWPWLDARSEEDLGLTRAGPDDPQWPPVED